MQGRKKSKRRMQEKRAKRDVVVVGAYITRNNLISVFLTFPIGEMSETPQWGPLIENPSHSNCSILSTYQIPLNFIEIEIGPV